MNIKRWLPLPLLIACLTAIAAIAADMPGSQDHPEIPRVADTVIVGYMRSDYDAGIFVTGMENREIQSETVEGERTRIMYLGPVGLSPLAILRNYQKALESLGRVTEIFSCRDNECYANFADAWVWSSVNQIPSSFPKSDYLYRYSKPLYRSQSYWYGTAQSDDSLYHVSVFTSIRTDGGFGEHLPLIGEGQTLTHLEILKVADFEPSLTVVTADEIATEIGRSGHIALYGIHFDSNSDELRADSKPALTEIAGAMQTNPLLSLYVVGHTDNEGGLEYNQALSNRRAMSVVETLGAEHGIKAERLIPIGIGPVAPIASNDTEEGRALNRRVELVKR